MLLLCQLLSSLATAIILCNAQPLGSDYNASLPYNITLAATNTTVSPNQNSTGVPLVLGQNGNILVTYLEYLSLLNHLRGLYRDNISRHISELSSNLHNFII